jgi:amino-acid N-acetyltransferase
MTEIIRDAKVKDIEQINHILETNGQINDIKEDEINDFIVAEIDGKVVGCGKCSENPDSFEIAKISVLPPNQGKGIGMEIVMTLLGRSSGKRCWLLSVDSHNFWELFDFRKIPEEDEPRKVKEQCANCGKRSTCNRVVMCREA